MVEKEQYLKQIPEDKVRLCPLNQKNLFPHPHFKENFRKGEVLSEGV